MVIYTGRASELSYRPCQPGILSFEFCPIKNGAGVVTLLVHWKGRIEVSVWISFSLHASPIHQAFGPRCEEGPRGIPHPWDWVQTCSLKVTRLLEPSKEAQEKGRKIDTKHRMG